MTATMGRRAVVSERADQRGDLGGGDEHRQGSGSLVLRERREQRAMCLPGLTTTTRIHSGRACTVLTMMVRRAQMAQVALVWIVWAMWVIWGMWVMRVARADRAMRMMRAVWAARTEKRKCRRFRNM